MLMQVLSFHAKEMEASNKCHAMSSDDPSNGCTYLDTIITQAAKTYSVDKALMQSVITAESNYHSNSTSQKGAMDLMQLIPEQPET